MEFKYSFLKESQIHRNSYRSFVKEAQTRGIHMSLLNVASIHWSNRYIATSSWSRAKRLWRSKCDMDDSTWVPLSSVAAAASAA